ncbi:hypothetical protein [Prosthecodimorpha staleyi]|uniref:Uncharacterized protein n=1 Tax=Prosthecodimorpha staleyi TaxID=2840188 RepID=A0A947GA87_9HYPH|nr:hypothetical protein [Prosthecodimorpha staleyi]MBT9288843.1 hypothetical protein [Prosthecodimorpha staleyi]
MLMAKQKIDWFQAIKDIRVELGCDILTAERIALNDPDWRRWVEVQINRDPDCRKMARHHIRNRGPASLIAELNGRLTIRDEG